MGNEALKE